MALVTERGGPTPPNADDPDKGKEIRGTTRTTPVKTRPRRDTQPPDVVSPRRPGTIDDRRTTTTLPRPVDTDMDGTTALATLATGGETGRRGLFRAFRAAAEIGTGIAAGSALSRLGDEERPELHGQIDPTAHFFGSTHADGQEAQALGQRLTFYGDPDAISWTDPDLPLYLARYQPSVLTVDMRSIARPDEPMQSTDVWSSVPRVNRLNPQAQYQGRQGVFVFSGDNSYRSLAGEPRDSALGQRLEAAHEREKQRAEEENHHNLYNWSNARDLALAITGAVGAGVAAFKDTNRGIPRRALLTTAVVAGVALATSKIDTVIDAAGRIPNPVWVRGRTAVAAAKDMDGKAYLREKLDEHGQPLLPQEAQSVILMGTGHKPDSQLLMSDINARDSAILELALHTRQVIQETVHEQFPDTSDAEMARITQDALLRFASMDIHFVSDPGVPEGIVNGPQLREEYIDPNVQTITQGLISLQVLNVLQRGRLLSPQIIEQARTQTQ